MLEKEIDRLITRHHAAPRILYKEAQAALQSVRSLVPVSELHGLLSRSTIKLLDQIDDYRISQTGLTILKALDDLRRHAGPSSAYWQAPSSAPLLVTEAEIDAKEAQVEAFEKEVDTLLERTERAKAKRKAEAERPRVIDVQKAEEKEAQPLSLPKKSIVKGEARRLQKELNSDQQIMEKILPLMKEEDPDASEQTLKKRFRNSVQRDLRRQRAKEKRTKKSVRKIKP